MRPWIVGESSIVNVGESIGDGIEARIVDPVTGAGLFNPNTDPSLVGIDPLTGLDAPSGTDVSFGGPVRRQVHTNVVNGDFAVLPPSGGASSYSDSIEIVSDQADARYNPLSGFVWVPPLDGSQIAWMDTAASTAFGNAFRVTSTVGAAGGGYLEQYVFVPASLGQQYRVLPSIFGISVGSGDLFSWAWLDSDYVEIESDTDVPMVLGETKIDCGVVRVSAVAIRLRYKPDTTQANHSIGEIRCAFLPAEAEVGLKAITASVGPITNSETQVVAISLPKTALTKGSTYRVRAFGTASGPTSSAATFRVRIGTSSLGGNIVASRGPTVNAGASSDPWELEAIVTVRSTGVSGTIIGGLRIVGNATQPFNAGHFVGNSGSTVVVNTTAVQILELTIVTANANTSVTVDVATIECIMAS